MEFASNFCKVEDKNVENNPSFWKKKVKELWYFQEFSSEYLLLNSSSCQYNFWPMWIRSSQDKI